MDRTCVSLGLAVISFFVIQAYGYELKHQVLLCGDEKSNDRDTCTDKNYYGLVDNAYKVINKCTDEKLAVKVQNLFHCATIAQDVTGAACKKNEEECRACQCLMLCLFQGMGVVQKDGKVDEQVMNETVHIMEHKIKALKEFGTNWAICKEHSVEGTDQCLRAHNTLICLLKQDLKTSMDIMYTLMVDLVIAQQCGKSMKCTKYPTFFPDDTNVFKAK